MPDVDGDYFLSIPYLALIAAMAVMAASALLIAVARYFDRTRGALTLSIIIAVAFVTATFASMVYKIQQTPLTEILVGALAASLGATITYWMSRHDRGE